MKIITLTSEEFDNFAKNHKYANYYQTSDYAKVMENNGYKTHFIGFSNNSNKLVGASLLLYKTLFLNFKYVYAPRGFLIDYADPNLIKEFTNKLQKLLFKQNFVFIKIDPLIHCSERNSVGNIISYNPEINNIISILKENKYLHHGFNFFFENSKPRWNSIVKLNKSNTKLYSDLEKQTRNKIRKAVKKGIVVRKANVDELETFYNFIKYKQNRNLKYYKDLFENFKDKIELYLAEINPILYLEESKKSFDEISVEKEKIDYELQKKDINNKEKLLNKKINIDVALANEEVNLANATKFYQNHNDNIVISGAIIIKEKKGCNLLIEGFDKNYQNYNSNYLLKWEIIKYLNNKGFSYFNLNAVTGDFQKNTKYAGLNESKFGFNSTAIEYIGEFDYIINKPIYNLIYKTILKKIIIKQTK